MTERSHVGRESREEFEDVGEEESSADSAWSSSDNAKDGRDAQTLLLATADTISLEEPVVTSKEQPATWSSLPRKGQLALLTICRLSEPLTQTSLAAYMYYQLKSFKNAEGESPSDDEISRQVGILAAAFTGAQFCTAIAWGRASDSKYFGRKNVILIGLGGTAIGSLGFGFSSSFAQAVFWRCVGGMLNGNVGVMRTMISEIVKEKRFQSRAFLLMPMTFNIGVIIGPLIGGLLADPVGSYPALFGPGSALGGADGVGWLMRYPYALPNVVSACFLAAGAIGVFLGLEETLEARWNRPDYGIRFTRWLKRYFLRQSEPHRYSTLQTTETIDALELEEESAHPKEIKIKRTLPLRRIWTANVLWTLLAHGLLASHVGTFSNLWFVFLSTPRYDSVSTELPAGYHPHAPFTFTGGLALPPPSIGAALAILGVIGIAMQLILYPRISFSMGTIRSYRASLILFPITYFLAPYLAVIPSSSAPPHQASGVLVWLGIVVVLAIQVTARTFALPATAILVNNACPHPSVLGSMHGIGQSTSAATRTIGPLLAGWAYGEGLNMGVVGLAWWCLALLAVFGAIAGRWVREGDGHEIWLEGEQEDT